MKNMMKNMPKNFFGNDVCLSSNLLPASVSQNFIKNKLFIYKIQIFLDLIFPKI